jgi:signal transduction histidine kinase
VPNNGADLTTVTARRKEGWINLKAFLFPGKAEQDPQFKDEIRRRSVLGLYIICGVTAIMPVLGYLLHIMVNLSEPDRIGFPVAPLLLLSLGGAMFAATRTKWGLRRARPLAFIEGILVATILVWANLLGYRSISSDPVLSALIDVIIVLVVALTAIPARPMQMAVFGWGISWINFSSAVVGLQFNLIPEESLRYYPAFDLIVILCVVLSGFNYQLLHGSYLAHLDRLASHSRLLNSETALSFSRLSATLSHELNSPLGALASSLDSLKALRTKEQADGLDRQRANQIWEDLMDGADKAAQKLHEIASRIERFTNLDRADSSPVEVDRMLRDIAQMVSPPGADSRIALSVSALPALTLKPQAVSSVFSRLMQNALRANSDSQPVEVEAHVLDGHVVVSVRDHGSGLSKRELGELFEPGFRAKGSRIGASNWGLFTARQIVREHGGEITAERAEGGGTKVSVQLPLDAPASIDEPV